jgi:hypothetical protein
MRLQELEVGMKVVCHESHSGFKKYPKWNTRMDGAVGKVMEVVLIDFETADCDSDIGRYRYLPEWLEPYKGKESDT